MATVSEQIQQIYIGLLGRAADQAGLDYWTAEIEGGVLTIEQLRANIVNEQAEYAAGQGSMTRAQAVADLYENLFNRAPEADGLEYWVNGAGSSVNLDQLVLALIDGASAADQLVLDNKTDAAEYYTEQAGDAYTADAAEAAVADVDATQASVDASKTATDSGSQSSGQTFTLTKGLDAIDGTSANDTIIGSIDDNNAELNTLSSIDVINGGAGTDTLKVNHASGAITLGNLSNVEVVEVSSAGGEGVTVDSSEITDITDLNVIKAAGKVDLTAAADTNIGVEVKGQAIDVAGGKDISIDLTNADSNAINVSQGAGDAAPKGTVTINATGVAAANDTSVTLGDISVTGGTTISVTQQATSDVSGLVAVDPTESGSGDLSSEHTQGDVTVTAGATTTEVTIKQDAVVAASFATAVAGATEVASVKFTSLDANETVTVGGLTFKAGKALTAEEVAQAFANLTADAVTPINLASEAVTADGDTQGSSAAANGTFSGSLVADWSSAAASGDTVVFTGKANTALDDLEATGATVTTTTQGVAAVAGKNTLGVKAGTVTVAGAAALETVTVDGYAASTGSAGITGSSNDALETINLSNGGDFDIASAAATLALNLTNVDGTVNVAAGTETLNATITGAATDTVTLESASAESVNVSGTGNVNGTTDTGGLTAATAINTSGMTDGEATFAIADGTKTAYTGGAGEDNVTISNANVAMTKAVELGAGDDTLTLKVEADTVAVPTVALKGGEGTDTIGLNGESAAALSANGDFAGKIEGFEKLAITDKVTEARTVNMANMDGITHVVSNNTTAVATAATKTTFTVSFAAADALQTGDSLAFDDATLNGDTANLDTGNKIALALGGLSYTNWDVKSISGSTITFEAKVAGTAATVPTAPVFAVTDTDSSSTITQAIDSSTAGAASSTGAALTLDKMANDSTLELVGAGDGVVVTMADATGTADSFNIVTKVDDTNLTGANSFGTVDVAGVETLTLNAVDITPVNTTTGAATINTGSLTLKADKATSLTVEGNSNVDLALAETTTLLATIDASALTGKLNYTANGYVAMTITGGAGADTLSASTGTDAKADVLVGGAGDDTLYAGSNGAKLTGGEGNDLFILTASSATTGSKEANTYTEITDFSAGDLLQLQAFGTGDGAAAIDVTGFAKLAAELDADTAVFTDYVDAAIKEAGDAEAVWFSFNNSTYVVVDSATDSVDDTDSFVNTEDMVIKLTGVDGNDLSWNAAFATLALV